MRKLCPRCESTLEHCIDSPALARCPGCGWLGLFRDSLKAPRIAPMKLPYVSIDLETTGLVPETCQILEFGAVFDDWSRPVEECPTFHRYIAHNFIAGSPFALQMNAAILRTIATRQSGDPNFCNIHELSDQFSQWMRQECGWSLAEKRITPAGKNFASFDHSFLRLCGFDAFFHHRTLDPAPLFWRPEDEKLPDSKTCMERAGIEGKVAHTAVADAVAVVHMIRFAAPKILGN